MILSSATVKQCAARLGFSACGLAPAEPLSAARIAETERWLAEGCHAGMDYLVRHAALKRDPRLVVEGARTVVSLAVNYYPGDEPTAPSDEQWHLARYACGTDYHEVVKQMLRQLLEALGLEEGTDGRAFVDTAPIDERYWAVRCGLGWRGRNAQLIIPGAGSYFFLGELVLTHEADRYDEPQRERCGSCHACLEACPTQALRGDGTLDARRCLSYLTIEHRGALPAGLGDKMGDCFYGCDRCAEACPWNKRFARPTTIEALRPRDALLAMRPADWRRLTVEQYRELFRKSAVKRAKYEGLVRNIAALATARDEDQRAEPMSVATGPDSPTISSAPLYPQCPEAPLKS